METQDVQILAEAHGLLLTDSIKFNEMGIDFRVAFALDTDGQEWLLRVPRRDDMEAQIKEEQRILTLVKTHLSVEVPDWQIASPNLVAYPLLKGKPVLTFDEKTYDISWNLDKNNPNFVGSLAKILVEIHNIPEAEARENGLKIKSIRDLREEIASQLETVKSEIGISAPLERRYQKWLDNDALWPSYTRFIHGDLYAGHVLTGKNGAVSGIIDWTTAQIGDPAVDFSGHVTVFGEESLRALIAAYEKHGGIVWGKLFEQAIERAAAAPLAYGFFAITMQDTNHIMAARAQLCG